MYSSYEAGRPGIDPVSLFKIVFIQYLFGIRSMRQTIKEIDVNVAYRWFIGYGLTEPIPHFSTFGKNYVRRFKYTDIFEHIFNHKEINNDRSRHGKSPLKKDETPKKTTRTVSTTDPDSGLFVKGEHERCMAHAPLTGKQYS